MPTITTMNAYVGMANAVPDSRRPRRLSAVRMAIAPIAMADLVLGHVRHTPTPRLFTPAEVDTATVRM